MEWSLYGGEIASRMGYQMRIGISCDVVVVHPDGWKNVIKEGLSLDKAKLEKRFYDMGSDEYTATIVLNGNQSHLKHQQWRQQ